MAEKKKLKPTREIDESDSDDVDSIIENFAQTSISGKKVSKGYRTLNRKDVHDESEGDSESDDPTIVWRGLTQKDYESLKNKEGLKANTKKSGKGLYEDIRKHIENGSNLNHNCGLMSATRSKKVGARYSSHKLKKSFPDPPKILAKIKLTPNIGCVDLTNSVKMKEVGLTETTKKFAENSQEVILYSNIPQESIIELYRVENFWKNEDAAYQKAKKSGKYDQFVKFRAYGKDVYFGFVLKKIPLP